MTKKVKLSEIKPNPNNPRIIKDDKFKKLVQSLKDMPEMAEVRSIVVNQDMVILGGNMRYKAMKEAGWKEALVQIVDWDEEKQKEFIIKDNVGFGEWDWEDLANNWIAEELESWGLDIPDFKNIDTNEIDDLSDKIKSDFRIEVICGNEKEQEIIYNKLIEQGFECRLLTL